MTEGTKVHHNVHGRGVVTKKMPHTHKNDICVYFPDKPKGGTKTGTGVRLRVPAKELRVVK